MGASDKRKHRLAGIVGGAAIAFATLVGAEAKADIIQWSDTFVGLRYGAAYAEPANVNDVEKVIVQGQHVSGWTYGQNFVNIDILFDLKATDESKNGSPGTPAKEIYAVFREKLSSSKIFGMSYGGIIRDVGLTIGGDLSYKNDNFNARVRKFVIGPTIDFEVPGFLSVGLLLGTEHNNNGLAANGVVPSFVIKDQSVDFDPTWRIEAAWGLPLPIDIGVPVSFNGFMNIIGPKGEDGFGNDTTYEILLDAALMFDVGAPLGTEKTFYLGFGYQWWKNKFGNDPKYTANGTEASVPQVVAQFHF
ncbi:MAG: hypothetical protein PHS60_05745 [Zavarzinia sp.]|nr:hypothetical protein [Zavarzinia sp.]